MASSAEAGGDPGTARDRPLAGRTVLVAGASRGIGRAVARAAADAGAGVWMTARSEGTLAEAAGEIGARHVAMDAGDPDAVDALRRDVLEGGPLHALVVAAGAFALAPLHRTAVEDFDAMIRANLRAPFLLARAFLPDMLERGDGHVVTLGSIAGRMAMPGNAAYSASKFGVRGLHAVLAAELKGTGVRATLVEPAATDTPLWDPLDPDSDPGLPPRSEMLRDHEVADAVIYAITRPAGVAVPNLLIERS